MRAARFDGLDTPEVDRVPRSQLHRMPPAPSHPDATQQLIDQTPQHPEPGRKIPPPRPTNALDGLEGQGRWSFRKHVLAIYHARPQSPCAPGRHGQGRRHGVAPSGSGHSPVFKFESARHRLPRGKRTHPENIERSTVPNDGLVSEAVDQLPSDARVDRRHESQPEAGKARAEKTEPEIMIRLTPIWRAYSCSSSP